MLDLRKRAIVAVKVKPKDSKADDFHTALADYLYKELKHQGLEVKRNNVNLKIKLDKLHDDKYDHIVIDCVVGKLFLRGIEVKDKFFGKLRRFEGSRPADAYHCVVQSATRIVNRVKRLMNDLLDDNDEREIYAEEIERIDLRVKRIDMRKKYKFATDLRKIAEYEPIYSETDFLNREKAILYINGEILEGDYHGQCIDKYLREHNLGQLKETQFRPAISVKNPDVGTDEWIIQQNVQEMAFAHLMSDGSVHLETDSLYHIDQNTVVSALKAKYHTEIFDDNQYDSIRNKYKKIAKRIVDCRKKKAEIIDGFNDKDGLYREVYRNPTQNEIENVKESDSYGGIKGAISNGTLYIWPGSIPHYNINKFLRQNIDVDTRITIEDNMCEIWVNLTENATLEDLQELLKKYSILFKTDYKYAISTFKDQKEKGIDPYKYYPYDELLDKIYK